MSDPFNDDVRRLFDRALGVAPAERTAWLDEACAGDDRLRTRVQALLAAADAAEHDRFLADLTADATPPASGHGGIATDLGWTSDQDERPGATIDRYKLLQPIGEGGFGVVWMAEQREPVKRRVALKIIKLGMDTRQVIARFEAERQALAMMDHPNIAKVHDAGTTATGRPYFVMEYIRGVPILEYCDTERTDTRGRLDLFTQVCNAIQHAHQKGIIHRDIKPANVLVTMHDGVPVPKVIDFGIAKATNTELTQRTLFTEHRQMIGTPAYMSPEQAEMSGLDIDTRADIYSLGVLLYELLTGTTPFDGRSLLEAGFGEMMRIIREETPPKPSTRLSSLGGTSTRVAEVRRLDARRLGTLLRGDLDWIVMKCLEKDRTSRYDSASLLAGDILRHLASEPVLAGPPSAAYRVSKFVRRNRGQVVAAGLLGAALVAGVIGTGWGMLRAIDQRERADVAAAAEAAARETAEANARRAEDNEQRAMQEAERAERELARATEVKRLITDMIAGIDPSRALGADTALLEGILDDTVARLEAGEVGDELVAAELPSIIGRMYVNLGFQDEAEPHLDAAREIRTRRLGPEDVATLQSMSNVAQLLGRQGRDDEYLALIRTVVETLRRVAGADARPTLQAEVQLSIALMQKGMMDEAETLAMDVLERQRASFGPDDPDTLVSMSNLVLILRQQFRFEEAEALMVETVERLTAIHDERHPTVLTARGLQATLLQARGAFAEAAELIESTLELQRQVLGPEHGQTLAAMASLSTAYQNLGRFEEALRVGEDAWRGMQRSLGEEHPTTVRTAAQLGHLRAQQGRFDEAEAILVPTLAVVRRLGGDGDPYHEALAMQALAAVAGNRQDWAGAGDLSVQAADIMRAIFAPDDPRTFHSIGYGGEALQRQGRFVEAEPLLAEYVAWIRRTLGDDHPNVIPLLANLATVQNAMGRTSDAAATYAERLPLLRRLRGPEHRETLGATTDLGGLLLTLGRPAEAAALYETSLPIKRRVLGLQHQWTAFALRGLAEAYLQLGRPNDAEPLLRDLMTHLQPMLEIGERGERELPPLVHYLAAWTLSREVSALQDAARAIDHAERAVEIHGDEPGPALSAFLETLADAHWLNGDAAAAASAMRRAIGAATETPKPSMVERLATYDRAVAEAAAEAAGGDA
jgi:tetratricopeptide (TPR) repeat protein